MSILSAQSIRKACFHFDGITPNPKGLITPFIERGIQNGKSYGLSACTYDCRIADGLIIPVHQSRLAATVERFCFPHDICGSVLDKSSWARIFITAFNTHLDPGWEGYLTVELANLGSEAVIFEPGDPLCQIKFEWLDEPTELPYSGKYQQQGPLPTPAKSEEKVYNLMKNYDKQRFWSKVKVSSDKDECWIWTSNKHIQGYGFFKYKNKNWLAHRIAYALENNIDLIDLIWNTHVKVLHSCDNPGCCNPNHLILGTQSDNVKDMILKGRRGVCNAKLTWEEVEYIRNDERSNKEIAQIYNMSESSIYYLRTRRNWNNQSQEAGPQKARNE